MRKIDPGGTRSKVQQNKSYEQRLYKFSILNAFAVLLCVLVMGRIMTFSRFLFLSLFPSLPVCLLSYLFLFSFICRMKVYQPSISLGLTSHSLAHYKRHFGGNILLLPPPSFSPLSLFLSLLCSPPSLSLPLYFSLPFFSVILSLPLSFSLLLSHSPSNIFSSISVTCRAYSDTLRE